MTTTSQISYEMALRDFHDARRQAVMQQFLARFRGGENELLPFHALHDQLGGTGETIKHGVQEIPLDKIVGSVDRYRDFTRSFLPKRAADEERWAGVRAAVIDMVGMPPIHVYQLGDAYFVADGNHRVSIARRLKTKTISAYVTEVVTRVPLTADDDPNEIICKAHYADFLEQTNLDKLRPDSDLMMTFSGQYHVFLSQIEARCGFVAGEQEDMDEWGKAVADWYDNCYMPVIQVMRELGVLHRFPERTEADMYVLLSERRDDLEKRLGWRLDMETGVSDLMREEEPQGLLDRVRKTIVPPTEEELRPGTWRKQQLARKRYHHLFEHILLPLDGSDESWRMFDYMVGLAALDHDHILGLHVVPNEAKLHGKKVKRMRARFEESCREAGLRGEFAVAVDENPVRVIARRAAWVDCVVVHSERPPQGRPLARLDPGLKELVQRCPRPIQVRPDGADPGYSHALLAYDGSPKANEALFIAAYITARWLKSLTVVTVETNYTSAAALERAKQYLTEHGLTDVNYVLRKGPIAEIVLETAEEHDSNLLFMGGFGFQAEKLGSAADRILRQFPNPMWICQ